jgi:cobalt-zinc-cadmium efflux system protein
VTRGSRLRLVLGLNIVLVVAQVVVGWRAHSVGLVADAGHNLADVAAVVVSLLALALAARAPTERRSFGYHRATILAAQANAASVLVVSALLAWGAIVRFVHPHAVQGVPVIVMAVVALAINLVSARIVHDGSHNHAHAHGDGDDDGDERPGRDLNMRSVTLHMLGDAAASLGVLVAGIVIAATAGWYWLDPAASLLICALIALRATSLLRDTADVLLEATPAHLDPGALTETMASVAGIESVHDVHAWSLSSDVAALSAHLVLDGHPTLEEAQIVGARVKDALRERYGIAHATLELECETCAVDDAVDPCAIGVTPAEPARRI